MLADVRKANEAVAAAQNELVKTLGGAISSAKVLAIDGTDPELGYGPDFDESEPRYELAEDGAIVIADSMVDDLTKIAFFYFLSKGQAIIVTSGYRSPASQAAAMFRRIEHGDPDLAGYHSRDLTSEILAAHHAGRAAGETPEQVTMDISRVIATQVARGRFVSRHLNNLAFDVRFAGTDGVELTAAAHANHFRVIDNELGVTPHYHLQAA